MGLRLHSIKMRIGQKYIKGNFLADQWVKIYENILSSAATSITISNLDGDSDEEYRLIIRVIGGTNAASTELRPNNDSGSNYGYQYLLGQDTAISAVRGTLSYFFLSYTSPSELALIDIILHAKRDYVRTLLQTVPYTISGTTISNLMEIGQSWNNTSDNITSLVILASASNGLGIGTSIELYKKKYKY